MRKMQELLKKLAARNPEEALGVLAAAMQELFGHVAEEVRLQILLKLVGGAGDDQVASMVHRWLAHCLDEGIDPTQMCQKLVDRVAQSRQLMAVAEPDLLLLFEDWLDELEQEVVSAWRQSGPVAPETLARSLGLSPRGATFLISKLQREGKLS